MTLMALIYTAYGDGGFNTSMRVTGGPDWINRTAFAVEGVASAEATPRQLRLMLQTLLEERFALKIRNLTQTQDIPMDDVLALVVDRSDGTLGPKVKQWDGTCPQVLPVLYLQASRRPLRNRPTSEADDPAVPYCPTLYRADGVEQGGASGSDGAAGRRNGHRRHCPLPTDAASIELGGTRGRLGGMGTVPTDYFPFFSTNRCARRFVTISAV